MTSSVAASVSAIELARWVARAWHEETPSRSAGFEAAMAQLGDWPSLRDTLARHGLIALALRSLEPCRASIPELQWKALQEEARLARAQSLAGGAELGRLATGLAAAGIRVLAIKGPVLAELAYGDPGARPFADLDLLVSPARVPHALDVLRELGYASAYAFSPRQDAWFRRVDGDYPLEHRESGQLVELHARALSRRFSGMPPFEDLWERRQTAPIAGADIHTLGRDDTFILHALHGAKHRWERLEWVVVTGALLCQRAGDVSSVLATAPAARRAILLACGVARDWLGTPLAASTYASCAGDREVSKLVAAAWRHAAQGAGIAGTAETSQRLAFNFRVQYGATARFRFLYRWLCWPSPEDWALVRLPDLLFFVYRLIRPVRLIGRYAQRDSSPEVARA